MMCPISELTMGAAGRGRWARRAAQASLVLAFAALSACDSRSGVGARVESASARAGASAHAERYVAVGDGTRLHYLDWGGSGPPIIFLAGNGHSAHVFDGFAPRFKDGFHVLGLTRRGFGQSAKPLAGYDRARLADDIRDLMDSLGIRSATLIGHSIAGEELTRFAVRHPERTSALVFLDAAYDQPGMRAAMMQMTVHPPMDPEPTPTSADSASVEALAGYWARVLRAPYPIDEVRATATLGPGGAVTGEATPDTVNVLFQRGIEVPDWAHITAPSLAIYAVTDSLSTAALATLGNDAAARAAARRAFAAHDVIIRGHRDRFRREVRGSQVVELHGADHYVFLSNPTEVEQAIREFLTHV